MPTRLQSGQFFLTFCIQALSTTLCVTRFLSFNVEHLRNTWKVLFSPSRIHGNLQYNLGGFTTLWFFNTNICHIVMLQPGFPAFRWFMHVQFHIHSPKISRRISELWWWLRMERFQLLLFWGGSPKRLQGTGTNAAGCKRLGSSPIHQAGCGSAFVSEKACNVKTRNGTPWKINMEPENTPLEKENHLPNHHFQVLC